MEEITVQELNRKKLNDESFFLLDVREPFEYQISNIEGTLIPLDQLSGRLDEIEDKKNEEVIVMCRSGSRSAKATKFLQEKGFSNVKNLKGGVNEWAREIDSGLPVY
ncbi:MAG: rhodanese-like domain-containing protein [Balneolaceae bacterium]